MNKLMTSTTARKPSFGMPAYGATHTTSACTGPVVMERVRQLGVIAVDAAAVATAQGAFPGTTAWRPPSC